MQKPPLHPWFDAGDVAPVVELRTAEGKTRPITRMAGRTAVVHVVPAAGDPGPAAAALSARSGGFAAAGADLYVVRQARPEALGTAPEGLTLLGDAAGMLAHNLGLKGPATAVFDRASRLTAVLPLDGEAGAHAEACLALVRDRLPVATYREGPAVQAPVMVIPNVLPPEWCRWLMHVHDTQGNEPSGFIQQVKGESVLMADAEVKVRRDHVVPGGSQLEAEIRHIFQRRVIPEIVRATHSPIQRHELFKIVRYVAEEGGHFRPHRDNTSTAGRTRRFAVTLNLNTGDYEGGHLVFPEYGDIGYRPAAGEAVVFSCSLLHEARPVTRGTRYVLLAFLH